MDIFTYLMSKKGKNYLPHKNDLFAYLLGRSRYTPIEPKVATGTTINITALKTNINEFKLSKESTQGNQLFNFNTSNYLTYGSVNVSGKADDFIIEGVGTYDLRTYCVGLINYNTLYKYMTSEYAYLSISVYITDNETYSTWVAYANARTQINANWNTNSLDLSNYQGKYLWIQLRGGNGTTYSSVNYKNFILSKTSVSSYEPYTNGASPNPNYPQEVKTVKGYRNLFDKDNVVYVSNLAYNNNFTAFQNVYYATRVYYLSCKSNTTYTYNKSLGIYCRFGSCQNIPSDGVEITTTNSSSSSEYATITTGANDNYIFFSPLRSDELGTLNFDDVVAKIQITETSQVLPYVPYGTNWIYTTITDGTNTKTETIPLGDNEICGIGDYKDELIVDKNGHCWLNKKTGKVVLNGSENDWEYQSNSRWPFRIVLNDILPFTNTVEQTPQNILCNYFSVSYWNNTDNNGTFTAMKDYNKRIAFANTSTATLEDFKTWLSTHNTDVYYVLAEENLIDLNYFVDMTLYEGTNTITNSENANMYLIYY